MTHLFTNKKWRLIIFLSSFSIISNFFTAISSAEIADMVIARVNEEIILKSELETQLEQLPKGKKPLNRKDRKSIERDILDGMIEIKLILLHAKENNIYVSEKEIEAILNDIAKSNNLSRKSLETAISSSGISLDYYKQNIKEQRLISKIINREVNSKVQISDQEVSDYYEKHKWEFKSEEEVRGRHILIPISKDASKEKKRKARRKIQAILKKIKGGEDFVKMVELYSEDSSASVGGDLGFFKRGEMIKKFEDVAFSLKAGEISGIVKTDFGYHIIKIEEKKGLLPKELTEVSTEIKNILYKKKSMERRNKFIENLKKKAIIEVKDYKVALPENI